MDSGVMSQIIRKARLTGQNTAKGDDKKIILYIALGSAIGFLICWMVMPFLGV
jgi:hypothetical protein